jgi:hypothetical protein
VSEDSDTTAVEYEATQDSGNNTAAPPHPSVLVKRRMDAFAPNNQPVGDITERHHGDTDPNYRPHNTWAKIRERYRRELAEWLGTTLMIFIGVSAELTYVTSQQQNADILTMYLSWGFAVMIGMFRSQHAVLQTC